jgi:phosphate/sulfate permease
VASSAKTTIITIIKKVGIGVLIKTAVGKALVALLAAVGIAHVPLAWIILPLIAAFLAHEYFTFPKKLAKKLPSEMRYAMSLRFGELNEKIAASATHVILAVLEKEITKVRTP